MINTMIEFETIPIDKVSIPQCDLDIQYDGIGFIPLDELAQKETA